MSPRAGPGPHEVTTGEDGGRDRVVILYSWVTVRLPTITRRSLPAVAGGGVLAVCAAVAVTVAALSGSGGADAAPAGPASGSASLALPSAPEASRAAVSTSPAAPTEKNTATEKDTATEKNTAKLAGATTTHLVVPDVIASVPGGVTAADLAKIKGLSGVRAVLAVDGARIAVNGKRLTVLAAPAAALRPWTPPTTAGNAQLWSQFAAGDLITTRAAATAAQLVGGSEYPVAAAVNARITAGGTAWLGVTGVDGIVNQTEGRKLGLVRNVAVLVNAPAADMTALVKQVQKALGAKAQVIRLVSVTVSTTLPVDTAVSKGRPTSYLQLFQESAAEYCPGLSWTVLAAIGQIESADGQNMGPSTAGALGPMQFLPSTWAEAGIDGFGDTGAPDIWNPYDAVPSAARMLCADGAASGGAGLRGAIFGYNHADWYVDEVLTLAAEYAAEY